MRIDHPRPDTRSASPFTGYDHSLRHRTVWPASEERPHPDASLTPFGPLVGVQPIVFRREHPLVTRARRFGIWVDRLTFAVVVIIGVSIFGRAAWAVIQRGGL